MYHGPFENQSMEAGSAIVLIVSHILVSGVDVSGAQST